MKRLDRILNIKPMRHQPPQIHHPTLHQPYRTGPRIRIAVLKLQINLLRTQPHKRQLHLRFPDPNHEHFPAEFHAVDRGVDAGFHARAFERDGGLDAACERDDLLGGFLFGDAALYFVRADAGDEVFCEGETAFVDVRYDDGFGARCGGAQEGDEADRSRATDQDRVTESNARALDARESHGKGFEQRAVLKGHVADLVAPDGGVVDVAAQEAVDGRGGEEAHGEAAVVAAREAGFAVAADDVRFDGDAVARGEVRDGGVGGEDDAGGFVAEDVRVCHDHGADAAGVPEVDVGSVIWGGG